MHLVHKKIAHFVFFVYLIADSRFCVLVCHGIVMKTDQKRQVDPFSQQNGADQRTDSGSQHNARRELFLTRRVDKSRPGIMNSLKCIELEIN